MTELKERGFTNDEIASVTGYKSSDSVAAYHRRRRDIEKRKLSDACRLKACRQIQREVSKKMLCLRILKLIFNHQPRRQKQLKLKEMRAITQFN